MTRDEKYPYDAEYANDAQRHDADELRTMDPSLVNHTCPLAF